ncbi:hypothetical protein R1flu_008099 [Riccia fluitans]|uniref:Uncharacterized protein n=1 Tax=Riccia fluitans TaxID=41844 RepID=A0ABD1YED1_9MARC
MTIREYRKQIQRAKWKVADREQRLASQDVARPLALSLRRNSSAGQCFCGLAERRALHFWNATAITLGIGRLLRIRFDWIGFEDQITLLATPVQHISPLLRSAFDANIET